MLIRPWTEGGWKLKELVLVVHTICVVLGRQHCQMWPDGLRTGYARPGTLPSPLFQCSILSIVHFKRFAVKKWGPMGDSSFLSPQSERCLSPQSERCLKTSLWDVSLKTGGDNAVPWDNGALCSQYTAYWSMMKVGALVVSHNFHTFRALSISVGVPSDIQGIKPYSQFLAIDWVYLYMVFSFPGGSDGKESTCIGGWLGSVPWLGISLGGGHGILL